VAPNNSDPECEISDTVRSIRAGDVQAYAAIVRQFQGPIVTLCTALLQDRQAAEELAQDVFVQAFRRLDAFDVRRPMKPWLVKITYRLAQQRWRGQTNEASRKKAAVGLAPQNHGDARPVDRLQVAEQTESLWQAVHALPEAQRTAAVLYYRENLKVEEVAEAMRISSGTVKTHLFRARRQLHADLRARGFDEGDL
jgi:RNA polymerase sigma factor (sigma-70 family)